MPEFKFKNPHLEIISNSLIRLNKRIDLVLFKLFFIFNKNRSVKMQDSTVVNVPIAGENTLCNNDISLKSFSEIESPVLKSEGILKEKTADLQDLKKIHKD